MADQAQLEVVIEAQADRVLQGLASFESSLGRLEKAHATAEHAAKQHGNEVKNLEHQLESGGRLSWASATRRDTALTAAAVLPQPPLSRESKR